MKKMEEIEINGRKYISEEDVEKNYVTKELGFKQIIPPVLDDLKICGIGSFEIKGEWVKSRVAVEFLLNVANALKSLKIDSVDIVFAKDNPVLFGTLKDNKVAGFAIAPRIDNG